MKSRRMKSIKKQGGCSTVTSHLRQPWEQFCFLDALSTSCLTSQQVLYDISRLADWNTLQYSCLENHGQRSLAGYSPWGHKESDTIERLT